MGMPDMTKIDRIISDLLSNLLDYDPEEDWKGWVEMYMNDAWDLLLKAGAA